jgi:hypothetical protein
VPYKSELLEVYKIFLRDARGGKFKSQLATTDPKTLRLTKISSNGGEGGILANVISRFTAFKGVEALPPS